MPRFPYSSPFARLSLAVVAAALAAGCGGYNAPTQSGSNNNPPPTPSGRDIIIVVGASTGAGAAFDPATKIISLSADPNVRFINEDISGGDYTTGTATVHRIVSDDGTTFDTGNLGGNATSTKAMPATGTYDYHCTIHPNMTGTIIVNP